MVYIQLKLLPSLVVLVHIYSRFFFLHLFLKGYQKEKLFLIIGVFDFD